MDLARYTFEAVIGTASTGELLDLSLLRWIDARSLELPRFVASGPSILQRSLGIASECEALLLAIRIELPELALSSVGRDLQVEAAFIGKRDTRFALGTLGAFALEIGEHRGTTFGECPRWYLFPALCPYVPLASKSFKRTLADKLWR